MPETQTLLFNAGTGLTIACKLFGLNSDTVVATATAVERTNDKNRYAVAFTDIPAGAYRLNGFVSNVGGFANEVYDLTLSTATFYPRSEAAINVGAIADAVWDESYNQHTTAGSFGKLMDLLRKANTLVEGTVQASPAPTSTVFKCNVNYPTGAFEHAVLVFQDDATLAEQNSPILTWVNNGDGTSTVTLEEARTAAPVAGDKFFILPASHVHAIADIKQALQESVGTGARTVTVTVNYSGNPVQNAIVRMTKNAETYIAVTNASGQAVLNLNDGTWVVGITAANLIFAGASLVVDGTETVTYSMTAGENVTPSSPPYTTGYATVYDLNGVPQGSAQVSIQASSPPPGSTGIVMEDAVRTATANANGVVQFSNLVRGATYIMYRTGSTRKFNVTVPATAGTTVALPSIVG
jgi:hypothetical protein